MFSWLKSSKEDQTVVESVLSELKKIYKNKLLPLEEHYQFHVSAIILLPLEDVTLILHEPPPIPYVEPPV